MKVSATTCSYTVHQHINLAVCVWKMYYRKNYLIFKELSDVLHEGKDII